MPGGPGRPGLGARRAGAAAGQARAPGDLPGTRLPLTPGEVAERVLDRAVERRVGVHHALQPGHRHLAVDRDHQGTQYLTARRPGGCGADQERPFGIRYDLDEAVVARLVNPAAG